MDTDQIHDEIDRLVARDMILRRIETRLRLAGVSVERHGERDSTVADDVTRLLDHHALLGRSVINTTSEVLDLINGGANDQVGYVECVQTLAEKARALHHENEALKTRLHAIGADTKRSLRRLADDIPAVPRAEWLRA